MNGECRVRGLARVGEGEERGCRSVWGVGEIERKRRGEGGHFNVNDTGAFQLSIKMKSDSGSSELLSEDMFDSPALLLQLRARPCLSWI